MTATHSAALHPPPGLLHGRAFDLAFLLGTPAVALALGGAALYDARLAPLVLAADLWFLSFPHNAATFTRIAASRADARAHLPLLLLAPLIALAAAVGLAHLGGLVALNTVYFFWQSFHYARQSYGVERAYRRRAGDDPRARDLAAAGVVYLVPLAGVLHRCAQRPSLFFGMPLALPPVPPVAAALAATGALIALIAWLVPRLRAPRASELGRATYLFSHAAVFAIGYFAIDDLVRGWLVVNVWHNLQYLLFVWAQNQRRVRAAGEPARPLLAWLCAPGRGLAYATACLGVSTAAYLALFGTAAALDPRGTLALLIVGSQAINFHHYVVDALIWRTPRRAPRASAARGSPAARVAGTER